MRNDRIDPAVPETREQMLADLRADLEAGAASAGKRDEPQWRWPRRQAPSATRQDTTGRSPTNGSGVSRGRSATETTASPRSTLRKATLDRLRNAGRGRA